MRMATCTADGGLIITGAEDKSRTLGPGSRVDLDEVLVPAVNPKGTEGQPGYKPGRPARTMAESIGSKYMHLFKLDEAPATPRQTAKVEPKPDAETV